MMVNMAQQQRRRMKFGAMLLNSDHHSIETDQDHNKAQPLSPSPRGNYYYNEPGSSPYAMSPWSQASPFAHSPWATASPATIFGNGLIGSLVREEGHVYSLAVSGDLLYTGSDSKNIRVWKNLRDFTGFKSNSGLVKSIVIAGEKIFTGHQDGKIRVWRVSRRDPKIHRRIGSLPSFRDTLRSSVNPKNYVEVRRKRNVLKIRHFDAVSSMSLDEEAGILYSASWDRTVKAWSVETSKCLDSFSAHDDAVNAVAAGPGGLVFTGSADGTVKAWRRMVNGDTTEHVLFQTLLRQESAVTAVTVARDFHGGVLYCGSSDGAVNFWELHGKRLSHGGVLRGHKLAVLCLAAAGNLVLSGGADRNICAWRRDRESGAHECVSVLTGHAGPVKCLAVEGDRFDGDGEDDGGDGRWIVYSGSLDRSVKVWRVSEHAPDLKQLHCASEGYAPSPKYHGVTRLGQEALLRHQY